MFLTLEDPNAKIKGSRDTLGIQPIWAVFGRHVVANLTMQTDSTRGFTILLLGRYLTARLIEEGRLGSESALDAFLRFEQTGAYVREAAHRAGGDIRGIERVRSRLAEHRGRVPISASPDGLILGDQKVNGLWGLFSVSARASRLVPDKPVGLTPEAREFIECVYLPLLRPGMKSLLRLVAKDGQLDTRAGTPDAPFSAEQGSVGVVHGEGTVLLRRVSSRRPPRQGQPSAIRSPDRMDHRHGLALGQGIGCGLPRRETARDPRRQMRLG